MITTLDNAARLADHAGQFDDIVIDAAQGVSAKELRGRVAQALASSGGKYTVRTGEEQAQSQAEDLKTALGFLQPVLLAFGIIALFVGSFVIVKHFSATLAQRSQGARAAPGARGHARQVTGFVLFESLLIGLVAGVLGLLGGLLLAPGIVRLFKSFGADLPARGTIVEPRTVIVALLVGRS